MDLLCCGNELDCHACLSDLVLRYANCRDKKLKLSAQCKIEVFRIQQESIEDYRLDYKLFSSCSECELCDCQT